MIEVINPFLEKLAICLFYWFRDHKQDVCFTKSSTGKKVYLFISR